MAGSPRPGNVWRDLAAVAVDQLSTSLRERLDARAAADQQRRDQQPDRPRSSQADSAAPRPATPARPGSTLGSDIRDLVSAGIRSTTESLQTYQEGRERRRVEAPMRRARARAAARVAGAVGAGLLALGGVSGAIVAGATGETAVDAVPPAVLALGTAAGSVVLARDARRHRAEAIRLEKRLGATYAGALDLDVPGQHSVPLIPKGSAAAAPLQRLMAQQRSLAALLPDLESVAPEMVELAAQSERSLFETAERVVRLERARDAAGDDELITGPLQQLIDQLDDGVRAHQRLLEAAATVVVEMTAAQDGTLTRADVQEAADKLAALADGIREVRDVEAGVHRPSLGATDVAAPQPPAPRAAHPAPRSAKPRDRRAQPH